MKKGGDGCKNVQRLLRRQFELGGQCRRPPVFLLLTWPLHAAAMLGSASHVNSGQTSVKFAESQYTAHVDVARDDTVEDDDGVLALLSEDIEALIAGTGWNFDWQEDVRQGSMVDPVSATLTASLCQLLSSNCFVVGFWLSA